LATIEEMSGHQEAVQELEAELALAGGKVQALEEALAKVIRERDLLLNVYDEDRAKPKGKPKPAKAKEPTHAA